MSEKKDDNITTLKRTIVWSCKKISLSDKEISLSEEVLSYEEISMYEEASAEEASTSTPADKNSHEDLQSLIHKAKTYIVEIFVFLCFLQTMFVLWNYKFGIMYYLCKLIELIWQLLP